MKTRRDRINNTVIIAVTLDVFKKINGLEKQPEADKTSEQ